MVDKRVEKLAKIIVDYSTEVKKGERVIISSSVLAKDLVLKIYKLVLQKDAFASIKFNVPGMASTYYKYSDKDQLSKIDRFYEQEIENSQVYISIITDSDKELVDIDPEKIAIRQKVTRKISDLIVNRPEKMRRCLTLFPTEELAKEAKMNFKDYQKFVFNGLLQDWKEEVRKMSKVKKVLEKVNMLHILGKDTDLKISIKDRKFIPSSGKSNLPGGEIFCAPVKQSLNGKIYFEFPSIRNGKEVSDIKLEFKDGVVVKASASKNQDFLRKMISTDENSKYVGELGIGLNKQINRITNELLFDEKLGGTIHLALGMAYKSCGGGNDSAIHWDIIKDMKHGEIYGDGKLLFKNGKWLV